MSSSIKDNSPEDAKISLFPDEKLELAAGDERSIDKSDARVTNDTQVLLIDHHAERRLVWKFEYGPNRVLPIMMFCFGFVTTMVMVVKNFGGLMTIRWFLGMAESAFFPLVIYYQTTYSLSSHSGTQFLISPL